METLLQRKLGYFKDLKRITLAYEFKGTENEADDYISMIDKREYVLEKIKEIDLLIGKSENKEDIKNSPFHKQIEEIVKEIIDIDKKNKVIAEKIKQSVNLKINEIKIGKEISTVYNKYLEVPAFDSKR